MTDDPAPIPTIPVSLLWDLLAAFGVLITLVGLAFIYPPLALVGLGLSVTAAGVLGAKTWARR